MALQSMSWLSLCATVLALGLRHGLDADHLATIDGLTRFNLNERPGLSRWCGALFAGGHGCIVILVASTIGSLSVDHLVPRWISDFGVWISIGTLMALGLMNLYLVLHTPRNELPHPIGLRSRLLSRLTRTTSPLGIAALGALFAISFDTLSQAVLFSTTAARFGGFHRGALLGVLFTLGMLTIDGLNGLWIAALLGRADRWGRFGSRALGLFIALLSLAIAALGIVSYFYPQVDVLSGSYQLPLALLLVAGCALGLSLVTPLSQQSTGSPGIGDRGAQVWGRM